MMSPQSLRKTDWGLMLTILLILGAIYAGFAKPESWDRAATEIRELRPIVEKNEKDIAELRAINTTQMSMIIRELDGIHRELKK